jgi:hypothetical protein
MRPLKYVDRLNEKYRSLGFPTYEWTIHRDAPISPLQKPLNECCVSTLSTSGASRKQDPGFDPDARNDLRLDAIPANTPSDGFSINDNYYDHRSVVEDINCPFPIKRLSELAADGTIGQSAPRHWSGFLGRIYKRSAIIAKGEEFAVSLRQDKVDLLILVPACPLDHQTAGLVARTVEEARIATVTLSTGRDLSVQVLAPRTAFVNFPMGNAFDRPGDIDQQRRILLDALSLASQSSTAGEVIDLFYDWGKEIPVHYRETTREFQLNK